ncbi:hypothetical protein DPMN_167906 [Dreissena polymorpha]|uniref:Uncharacterized protein n=1 Tax=Dreissena polymorpha TaxID=45954 RepID=A0A9D4F1P7_DREPO|nr:hypothetical protein DPMN_167906 [Dreissena polymorpha]
MAQQIQLIPSHSSRTSSALLGLLSSPRCSGLVTRELADPDLPEVSSVEGRGWWDSKTTSVEEIRGGPEQASFLGR